MRSLLLILPALVALTAYAPTPVHADPYPWCAQYTDSDGGATNCGFVTWNQCMATVSGIGGFCQPNPFYNGRPFYTGPERVRRNRTRGYY